MAKIEINGTVTRSHRAGNGFGLKETFQVQGNERSRYWAVFPEQQHGLTEGETVKVVGLLNTKVTEPKMGNDGIERVYVDHSVGNATVERQGPAPAAPADNGWGATPF